MKWYSLQIPGNMVITKVKPRFFLPSVVLLWGAVVSFMALISDYKSLWGMRLCLGVSEAVSGISSKAMLLDLCLHEYRC